MARITHVKKSRKDQGNCQKCGKPMPKGSAYKHVSIKTSPYSSRTMKRCAECPSWRPSELTTSDIKGTLYAATEAVEDAMGALSKPDDPDTWEDFRSELESIRDDLAGAIRELSEMCEEKQSNMVDGFGHDTASSDEMGERAEAFGSWADEIEGVEFDDFSADPDHDPDPDLEDDPDYDPELDALSQWADEQIEKLDSVGQESPE